MADVESVLKGFKADHSKRRVILSAFMITAVINGLRPMAWVSVKWTPNVPGIRVRRVTCNHLNFYSVHDTKALSEEDHDALIERYCATRDSVDPKVEKKVGTALGYLCPSHSSGNGALGINYLHRGTIVRDDFTQTLTINSRTLDKVMREKKRYDKVFGKVEFVVGMY